MLDKIAPLLLTYNEAANIGRTLEQLRWASQIIVVDSFSDDETLEIVSSFPQARVIQRKFDTHEAQWNFALTKTGITSDWVLALDSDYVLTAELVEEIRSLTPDPVTQGYRASFTYCVHGKQLRSGIYPPVTILYRREAASYMQDGHTHKLVLPGRVENLSAHVLHDDRKPLAWWFAAQSRYTKLEAQKLSLTKPEDLSWTDRVRRWRIVAPPAMLFYCLILRGGILDGWAGFYYAFQRALAELMLSLYLIESGEELTESDGQRAKGKGESAKSEVPRAKSEEEPPNQTAAVRS